MNYLQKIVQDHKLQFKSDIIGSGLSNNALAQVNKGLKEMKRLHWEFKMNLQAVENQLQAIQRASSNAWNEREHLLTNYYDTLRSILGVLDNCENALEAAPQLSIIYNELKKILEKRGIESIQVKEGNSFNAELHKCEETIQREEYPNGIIVQVIEKGYMEKLKNGKFIVIRPAKVIINKK